MSFLDKFLNVMRLNPDDDDDFYNEDYDYDDEEEEVKPKSSFKKREKEDTFTDDYKEKPVKTTPKVTDPSVQKTAESRWYGSMCDQTDIC